MLPVDLTSS